MKFEKKDLNSCMLFKLRNYGLCVAMLRNESNEERYVLYNKEYLDNGNDNGLTTFEEYDNNLCDDDGSSEYDIISIKQFKSTNTVLNYVISNKEPKEWDWTEEEIKKDKDVNEQILTQLKCIFKELNVSMKDSNGNDRYFIEILYEVWNKAQNK